MSLSQYEAGKRYQTTKGEYYRYLPQEQALVFEDGRVVPVPANSLRHPKGDTNTLKDRGPLLSAGNKESNQDEGEGDEEEDDESDDDDGDDDDDGEDDDALQDDSSDSDDTSQTSPAALRPAADHGKQRGNGRTQQPRVRSTSFSTVDAQGSATQHIATTPLQVRSIQTKYGTTIYTVSNTTAGQISTAETGDTDKLTPRELEKTGLTIHKRLIETKGRGGSNAKYKVAHGTKDAFEVGKVIELLWADARRGNVTLLTQIDSSRESVPQRRFVVIKKEAGYCVALPISTYWGRGVAAPGVNKSHHFKIYTGDQVPQTLPEEEITFQNRDCLRPGAIQVIPRHPALSLDPVSRLNLGKTYQILDDCEVLVFGNVASESMRPLLYHLYDVWQIAHTPITGGSSDRRIDTLQHPPDMAPGPSSARRPAHTEAYSGTSGPSHRRVDSHQQPHGVQSGLGHSTARTPAPPQAGLLEEQLRRLQLQARVFGVGFTSRPSNVQIQYYTENQDQYQRAMQRMLQVQNPPAYARYLQDPSAYIALRRQQQVARTGANEAPDDDEDSSGDSDSSDDSDESDD